MAPFAFRGCKQFLNKLFIVFLFVISVRVGL